MDLQPVSQNSSRLKRREMELGCSSVTEFSMSEAIHLMPNSTQKGQGSRLKAGHNDKKMVEGLRAHTALAEDLSIPAPGETDASSLYPHIYT